MSMMWMQMPGQSRLGAVAQFLVMWLGMVSVMNLPLMAPVFLHTGRQTLSLGYVVGGYYAVWLIAGIAVCLSGTAMAEWALHSDQVSRLIPFFRSGVVIAASLFHARHHLPSHLPPRRYPLQDVSFSRGCRQGLACCISCAAPMAIQLALGMTNPVVIAVITIAIAAKRRLPRPNLRDPALSMAAIFTGVIMICTTRPADRPKPIDCGNTKPAHNTTQPASHPTLPAKYKLPAKYTPSLQYTAFSTSATPLSPLPATAGHPFSQP
jgi:predicted metal-binding membrane protein